MLTVKGGLTENNIQNHKTAQVTHQQLNHVTNPGATRRQLQPVESAKEPDAITRKTPSKAQHLRPSRAPHKRRKRRKRMKGEHKIIKEFYIFKKETFS